MAGNLALLLNGIGLAVAFTILLVTANTMSIAVRERQQEIGVLKTLGFSSGLVMSLILIEALLLGLMGGALGCSSPVAQLWRCPAFIYRRCRAAVPGPGTVAQDRYLWIGYGFATGPAGRLRPGLLAYRARITEVLRQV